MRLLLAGVQTVIIVGIGVVFMEVGITGGPLAVAALVVLGALTFIALGYVIASFAKTEEAANGMTQIVSVPMMFLSGIFFPLELHARVAAWRGLADAADLPGGRAPSGHGRWRRRWCRWRSMWSSSPAGWSACLLVSARFFRWQ